MTIFLKLIFAHLLGDFIFQSDRWVMDKLAKKHKSKFLYIHSLIHGLLAWLFVFSLNFWPYMIMIIVTHYMIDLLKILYQKDTYQKLYFFADQILHIAILGVASWIYIGMPYLLIPILTDQLWLLSIALVFLTIPSSVMIKMLISNWTPLVNGSGEEDTLLNAGKFIGILERLLIFTFIITQHWEGIGFLIAAKSIFRFGDLKESKDRKMTEYILIGTLLSFGLSIVVGLLFSLSYDHIS